MLGHRTVPFPMTFVPLLPALCHFPTLGKVGEKSCSWAPGCLASASSFKSQLLSDSSQNVSVAACRSQLQPPRSSLPPRCRARGSGQGLLSLSTPGSAMRGSGTLEVINNDEKLGLPWICLSIYNTALLCGSRGESEPHSLRGVIFNRDASIGRQPSRMAGAGW